MRHFVAAPSSSRRIFFLFVFSLYSPGINISRSGVHFLADINLVSPQKPSYSFFPLYVLFFCFAFFGKVFEIYKTLSNLDNIPFSSSVNTPKFEIWHQGTFEMFFSWECSLVGKWQLELYSSTENVTLGRVLSTRFLCTFLLECTEICN